MEIIALAIIAILLVSINRPLIFIIVFIEIVPRLLLSMLSGIMFSSGWSGDLMYEFDYYSKRSVYVGLALIFLLGAVAFMLFLCSRHLDRNISCESNITSRTSWIEGYSPLVLIVISIFLIYEIYPISGDIGSDLSISKRNYMGSVADPGVFSALHAIYPLFFLYCASYCIRSLKFRGNISRVYLFEMLVAFLLLTAFWIFLHQKSFILRTPAMFFFAPLLIYISRSYNISRKFAIWLAIGGVGFYCATAYQYREVYSFFEVPVAIGDRIVLEGQLNFIYIDQAISGAQKLNFFDYFGPLAGAEAAIYESVGAFGRLDLFDRTLDGQWTPSGLMPGFIFLTNIWPFFLVIWLLGIYVTGRVLLRSYRVLIDGGVIPAFFGLKLTLTFVQFTAQGLNLVSHGQFWLYLFLFIGTLYVFERSRGYSMSGVSLRI